jgi:hypothetical protein
MLAATKGALHGLLAGLVAALVALAPALTAAQQAPFDQQLYKAYVPVVAQADMSFGSAFYVAPGYARTARHVVATQRAGVLGAQSKVVCWDVRTDSAMIEVAGHKLPFFAESSEPLAQGERVTIAGWKRGTYIEVSTEVAGYRSRQVMQDGTVVGPVFYVRMAEIATGMSGGPVIKSDGSAAATMFAWGGGYVAAVPIYAAACQVPKD